MDNPNGAIARRASQRRVWALIAAVAAGLTLQTQPAHADSIVPKPPDLYQGFSATLLPSGKWLVAGGYGRSPIPDLRQRAKLYDPADGRWTDTGSMTCKHSWHSATLLADGRVLVAGGEDARTDTSCSEIYDPAAGTWKATGSLNIARRTHSATLLADGKVLVAGGLADNHSTNGPYAFFFTSAELYDPATEKWTMTGSMNFARRCHAAALLTNGLVLVAGGMDVKAHFLFSAELYNPSTGKWSITGEMTNDATFLYTATLQTNGQVLLTTSHTNAWIAGKLLYDPASAQWTAIGPRQPHFVSSRDLDRTLTIRPESGSSFLASEEVHFLVESADRFGATNIQLFRDGVLLGEDEESPMRYTLTNAAAGTYSFFARAAFANGLTSTSAPVALTFNAPGPQVFLAPGPTEFISDRHVKSSPATLRAVVIGVNPGSLTNLTLNGVLRPSRTGNFILQAPLTEGRNVFVLAATDNQGRTGQATTEVYLQTRIPTVSISEPTNHASINAMWVDVHGTFSATDLKEITVNEMRAVVKDGRFEASTVFLRPGTNTITAIAQDLAGNLATNTIVIQGPMDTNTAQTLPVQTIATPSGGFAPLSVSLSVQAHAPGKIQKISYDFDGDGTIDLVDSELQPVTHTFESAGEHFPIVTLQTSVGRFSSLPPEFWFFRGTRINVQEPPVLMSEIKIADPVDLKWTAASNLYVLSGSGAAISEFDSAGQKIRSLQNIGGKPTGFDVGPSGNLYVCMSASNQVWRFKPTKNSFEVDSSFGRQGFIGNKDGTSGSTSNQFNAPFDVAVGRDMDGEVVLVADSGNHRIERFDAFGRLTGGFQVGKDGAFVSSFGVRGTNQFQLENPQGLALDDLDRYLFIADSGNNRVVLADVSFGPHGTSGEAGTALGQFRGPTRVAASTRGVCVVDPGNDRIQFFDPVRGGEGARLVPLNPRFSISSEFGIKHPNAAAWVNDLLEEKVYIADTANNRVILLKLPGDTPEAAWNAMKKHLLKGDIDGAIRYFARSEADKYRDMYHAIGTNDLIKIISEIPAISPVFIEGDEAQYYFQQPVDGVMITFPIDFVRENGKWKISEY